MKRFLWLVLKKLPIILAVLVSPLTLYLVFYYDPDFLKFMKGSTEKPPERIEIPLPEAAEIDWVARRAACEGPADLVILGNLARDVGDRTRADGFFMEALRLDPNCTDAREALGDIRFFPDRDLDRFREFDRDLFKLELQPFLALEGQWLTSLNLQRFRTEWESTRDVLLSRLGRSDLLLERLDQTMRKRLLGRKSLAAMLRSWHYRVDASRPDILFVIEGEPVAGAEPAAAFLDTLGSDMEGMVSLFREKYLSPVPADAPTDDPPDDPSEASPGETPEAPAPARPFIVWVLADERSLARFAADAKDAVEETGVLLKPGDRSCYDRGLDMFVAVQSGDSVLFAGSESERRRLLTPFAQMVVRRFNRGRLEPWLAEGIGRLLALGNGLDSTGRLHLNGEGIRTGARFTSWIVAGKGAWPVPLGRLIECSTRDSFLWLAGKGATGAIEACALFCLHLDRTRAPGFLRRYAGARLAGNERGVNLTEILGKETFGSIEKALIEKYVPPAVLAAAGGPEKPGPTPDGTIEPGGSGEPGSTAEPGSTDEPGDRPSPPQPEGPGRETARPSNPDLATADPPTPQVPEEKAIPFLSEADLLALVQPGMDAAVLRPLILYLVDRHGTCGAVLRLRQRFAAAGFDPAGSGIGNDWSLLERAAATMETRLTELAAAGFTFRLAGVELRLESVRGCRILCVPAGETEDLAALPAECTVTRKDGRIEIACPFRLLDLNFIIGRFKNTLEATEEADRIAYSLFHLFTVDGGRLLKELGYVADANPEKKAIADLLPLYSRAIAGENALAVLAGEKEGDPEQIMTAARKVFRKVRSTPLEAALDGARTREILRGLVHRFCVHEKRYLLDAFLGFRGYDPSSGTVLFAYDFSGREERDDFEIGNAALSELFRKRLGGSVVPSSKAFQVRKNCLSAYGTDALLLRPVFTGEIDAALHFHMAPNLESGLAEPFRIVFGYGLDEQSRYVASLCLKEIDVDGAASPPRNLACDPGLTVGRTFTLNLTATDKKIEHVFHNARSARLGDGRRRGRVFLWVDGPRWFHVERLEIQASVDPEWEETVVAPIVDAELQKILN